jgi:16S rRNA (cytidine1402-2'-O)-methyltransferase
MTGTLYLVSTPIGNLEDMTVRALRVLREVALIAAEDTRRTAKLLHHYQIATPTTSFHAHNERGKAGVLLARLEAGDSIALVSDAGTPILSDPGEDLVRQAAERGLRVEALPGASAILAAVATSGMGAEGFSFLGFPPSRSHARKLWFAALAAEPRPLVIFEAPHRILVTLADALSQLGNRPLVAAREMTKIHEERVRGTIESVMGHFQAHSPRGEFTLVFGPAATPDDVRRGRTTERAGGTAGVGGDEAGDSPGSPEGPPPLDGPTAWRKFSQLTESGAARRQAIIEIARLSGHTSREVYSLIEKGKALEAKASGA